MSLYLSIPCRSWGKRSYTENCCFWHNIISLHLCKIWNTSRPADIVLNLW